MLALSAVLSRFAVRGWAGLALAGALFGWVLEAVRVSVAYEAVPVSLLWPAVGWHMPVDVGLGLWLLPAALRRGRGTGLAAAVALGLAWGAWSSSTPGEGLGPAPGAFALHALWSGALLTGGMALLLPLAPALWTLPRRTATAPGTLALAAAALVGLAVHPPGAAGLAALLALTLAGLARSGDGPGAPPLRASRGTRALPLLAAPPFSAATYGALAAAERGIAVEEGCFFLLFFATCVFLVALFHAFTRN